MRKLGIVVATLLAASASVAIAGAPPQTIRLPSIAQRRARRSRLRLNEGTPESRWSCSFEEPVTST